MENGPLNLWLKQSENKLVIVIFVAPWSGSAQLLIESFEQVKKNIPDLIIHTCDVQAHKELTTQLGVHEVPTTMFFLYREIQNYFVGTLSRKKIMSKIEEIS